MQTHRRNFMIGAGVLALGATATRATAGDTPAAGSDGSFQYEVTRTDAEWRERLTEEEYEILRLGGTEFPTTSPYWNTNDPGVYHCRGCGLPLYESVHYSPQEIGFVFFKHAVPNSTLLGIDTTDYNGALPEPRDFIEVHCRRCGSHLGHMVLVNKEMLHCINGTSLVLQPAQT